METRRRYQNHASGLLISRYAGFNTRCHAANEGQMAKVAARDWPLPQTDGHSFGLEPCPISTAVFPTVPLDPLAHLYWAKGLQLSAANWTPGSLLSPPLRYCLYRSFRSVLDSGLASQLGFEHITTNHQGEQLLKIPVYLPEAIIQQPTFCVNSPAPQLPQLTVEFIVQSFPARSKALQIFFGCDIIWARNADIYFSFNQIILFNDERNKLSMPLVRRGEATFFQNWPMANLDSCSWECSIERYHSGLANDSCYETESALNTELDLASPMLKPSASNQKRCLYWQHAILYFLTAFRRSLLLSLWSRLQTLNLAQPFIAKESITIKATGCSLSAFFPGELDCLTSTWRRLPLEIAAFSSI